MKRLNIGLPRRKLSASVWWTWRAVNCATLSLFLWWLNNVWLRGGWGSLHNHRSFSWWKPMRSAWQPTRCFVGPVNANTSMHSQTLGGALSMKIVKEATDADSCPLMKSWLGWNSCSIAHPPEELPEEDESSAPAARHLPHYLRNLSWRRENWWCRPSHTASRTKEALISQPPNSVFPQCDFFKWLNQHRFLLNRLLPSLQAGLADFI